MVDVKYSCILGKLLENYHPLPNADKKYVSQEELKKHLSEQHF